MIGFVSCLMFCDDDFNDFNGLKCKSKITLYILFKHNYLNSSVAKLLLNSYVALVERNISYKK